MDDTYIQSITLSIPSQYVNWPAKPLFELFQYWRCGTYRQYGHTSLFMIYTWNINKIYPILMYVENYFYMLRSKGILSSYLLYKDIKLHEIKLKFDIFIPNAIFCKVGRFIKDATKNTYYSDDYKQIIRKLRMASFNDEYIEKYESKGCNYSFLSVIQHVIGCSVVFNFSGKYIKYIGLNHLFLPLNDLLNWLCTLCSEYLNKVTDLESFKVSMGLFPFFPKHFQDILTNANFKGGVLF
jgi:hypothetical protein